MIFLILFGIIAVIVIALNIHDSSNLDEIREYFEKKNCQNIVYSKGSFKGICKNEIIQVNNSFTVDLEKNKSTFKLDKIHELSKKDLAIVINKNYKIEFKIKENMENFYKKLEEKKN
ncbi:MAG: hypothetical protein C0625_09350 [Arcobacter sp.]|mgnify:CR=1 FL=1|nr:MAG: hypothetical protein C0625_09350 [Arcobacter sp.]